MQIFGTIIILMLMLTSYFYFVKVKGKEASAGRVLSQRFYSELERMAKERKGFNVVLAGGDDNSEVMAAEAIKK